MKIPMKSLLQIQTGVASTSKDQIQIAQSYIPEQTVFEGDRLKESSEKSSEESSEEISLYPSAVAAYDSEEFSSESELPAHLLDLQTIDPNDHFFPHIREDVQRILDSYQSRPQLPPPIVELLQFIHDQKLRISTGEHVCFMEKYFEISQ